MTTSLDMAAIEKKSLGNSYGKYHEVKTLSGQPEEVYSPHHTVPVKSVWYSLDRKEMTRSTSNNIYTYEAEKYMDTLCYSRLYCEIPKIEVKPEYKDTVKIAWTENLGVNLVKEGDLTNGDRPIQKLDPISMMLGFQFLFKDGSGKRSEFENDIGNHVSMINWSDVLPKYKISYIVPWYYSYHTESAFPIFLQNQSTVLKHRFTYELSIRNLLRMQILIDDTWKNVDRKNPDFFKYLVGDIKNIDPPSMIACYAIESEQYKNFKKCKEEIKYYVSSYEAFKNNNPKKIGDTVEIKLSSKKPCIAIFWVAENLNAKIINNLTNFTTCSYDIKNGLCICDQSSLTYSDGCEKFTAKNCSDQKADTLYFFPSYPLVKGYCSHAFCSTLDSFHSKVGPVLGNLDAVFSVELKNEFPDDLSSDDDTTYMVHVRVLTLKTLCFKKQPDGNFYCVYD